MEKADQDIELKSLIDFAIGILIEQAVKGNTAPLGPYFHVLFIYGSSSDDCNRFTWWEDVDEKDRISHTYVKPQRKKDEMFRNCLFACAVPKGNRNLSKYEEPDASAIGYPMFTAQVML